MIKILHWRQQKAWVILVALFFFFSFLSVWTLSQKKKAWYLLVLFLKDSVKFWNSFVQSCKSQNYSLAELKEILCKLIMCVVTMRKQVTKMAWKILDSFIVHHASQKTHGYAKLWGASSSTWPCLGKGVGGDDLQRFPPPTAILGFCNCYGVPYFLSR